jgi:hypothetical protein
MAMLLANCSFDGLDEQGTQAEQTLATGTYNFGTLASPGKCMDVQASGSTDGTNIQSWTCNGTGAQAFRAEGIAGGRFRLINTSSGKCVDVRSSGSADGTNIQLWTCNGTGAQSFQIEDQADGNVRLINSPNGKCIDVAAAGTANGTNIQLWTCNGTRGQLWRPNAIGGPSNARTAQLAASQMGKGFNLGQMFEATQHPRTQAEARVKIDAYYNKGFRTVRIPITWTEPVGGSLLVYDPNVGQVNRAHERLAQIRSTVDYALSKPGMHVVINAHHEKGLKTHNRWWTLERLWQDIADIFKGRSDRLLYEILNEPHKEDANLSPMAPADLRFMTGKAYAKIRAVEPARIIIIGGNQWFAYPEMQNVWPHLNDVGGGRDQHIMATFHHYHPWTFNGDNQGGYDDAWTNYDMYNPMDVMRNWASNAGQGMPVYIGEWGVGWGSRYGSMQCNNIRLWYQMFHHDIAAPKGMPTSVWDDGGWFKIFDHATDNFANNLADCISGTCNWDGGDRYNAACR